MTARAPIETYANNHMIAELVEPRMGANVPRPFPRACVVGSGNETMHIADVCEYKILHFWANLQKYQTLVPAKNSHLTAHTVKL